MDETSLTIRNEIWHELSEVVFDVKYLSLFVSNQKKILDRIETISLIFIIVSAIGWFQKVEHSFWWMMVIITTKVVHYFRSSFFTSQERILEMKDFEIVLNRRKIELEELWSKFNIGDISNTKAIDRLKKLRLSEISDKYNAEVPDEKRINRKASHFRNNYMKKFQ